MEAKVFKLFPVPLYTTKIKVEDKDKQILLNKEYQRMPTNNGDVTVDRFLLRDEQLNTLKNAIMTEVNEYAHMILGVSDNIKFYMTNSWIIRHNKGDWAQEHDHKNSVISGVLYLKVDDKSGDIVFQKPQWLENMFPQMFIMPITRNNDINANSWKFAPQNNQLILFPSNLPHFVEPSESDEDRYVLAFNFFMKGVLGELEGQLELK